MEMWDIYDADKRRTGRTMQRNDWCLKEGEYHLTVNPLLLALHRPALPTSLAVQCEQERIHWRLCCEKLRRKQDWMSLAGTVVICLVTSGKIRVKEIIIFWMFIALSVILMSQIFVYKQRRQMDISLFLARRFKRLQSRGFSCIITA